MTFVVSVVVGTARTLNVQASEGGVHKAMPEPFISRGFRGRGRHGETAGRLPPGQYETPDFPVLSAGPTPRTPVATWDFLLRGADGPAARWTWDEFQALPHETVNTDIHCVTKWSKLDTIWEGVSLDTLLAAAIAWRLATVVDVVTETPRARTLVLDVPGWPGHRAGQHVDVRLTAEDGYQAERSYSIASAPEDARIALTVQRLDDGEVSPYLTDVLRGGDRLELRGPIGGVLLVGGGVRGALFPPGGGAGAPCPRGV